MGRGNKAARVIDQASRIHKSTWSYIGWALLYAGLWFVQPGNSSAPKLFAEILGADLIVNIATPFLIGGAGIITVLFAKQSKKVPWFAWALAGGLGLFCLAGAAIVIFDAGGWLVLAGTLLFLARLGWFFRRTGNAREIGMAFIRGLAGPWLFMLPALLIAGFSVGRRNLGFENLDWVPLFGTVYFGTQAGFEEFLLRLIEKPSGKGDGSKAP